MKRIKFKIANLEIYTFTLLFILVGIATIYFYGFLQKNVYNTITSSEVLLDVGSIRISDINLTKFNEVSEKIENKASSKKVYSKNFLE